MSDLSLENLAIENLGVRSAIRLRLLPVISNSISLHPAPFARMQLDGCIRCGCIYYLLFLCPVDRRVVIMLNVLV